MKTEELKEEIEMFKETEDEHSCNYDVGDDYCQGCFKAGRQEATQDEIRLLEKLDKIWAEQNGNIGLERIHHIVCNRYKELKQKLEKNEN